MIELFSTFIFNCSTSKAFGLAGTRQINVKNPVMIMLTDGILIGNFAIKINWKITWSNLIYTFHLPRGQNP